ncbi:fasciclin domain-containing protein [Thermocoleostomius sinensis]|uniref:Fasciclin domain-containing protein n=1 Tax=Thermocoleostomius sinensis A174 TaxID=2016057 RepID=A0A9E8ZGA4_9CYAN|nr:fasciclin domain-containing protein [Thermocoleostomius sinensis]WAL61242.1 fasciclin domain-containing protein [Thermocoleostomius sinensis A174]
MLRNSTISKKLLAGIAGLGLVGALAACTPPETAESPTTDAPATAESPLPGEDTPAVGTDPAAPAGQTLAGSETLLETVESDGSFSTLSQAIQAAGLEQTLSEPGPYTVFAPTDEAFAALPPEVQEQLLQPENQDVLRQILSYHVVPGSITSPSITPGEVETVAGPSVTIDDAAGQITVDGANVVEPDIIASNGVVHAIDQVLLPPDLQVQ